MLFMRDETALTDCFYFHTSDYSSLSCYFFSQLCRKSRKARFFCQRKYIVSGFLATLKFTIPVASLSFVYMLALKIGRLTTFVGVITLVLSTHSLHSRVFATRKTRNSPLSTESF